MANLLKETNNNNGEEKHDYNEFEFECWLKTNDLQQIKSIFNKYNMNTLDSLSISNNNFAKLISDKNIIENTTLITKIISSIQSLQQITNKHTKLNTKRNEDTIEIINFKNELQNNFNELKNKKTDILNLLSTLQKTIQEMQTLISGKFNTFENIFNEITNNIEKYAITNHNEYKNIVYNLQNITIDNKLYEYILYNIPKIISFPFNKPNTNLMQNNLNISSDLIIKKNDKLELKSNEEHVFSSVIIEENAILTAKGASKGKLSLKILNNLVINKNGMITVNGLGYIGGNSYESGASISGTGFYKETISNIGGGGGGECGGGGGYGTEGKNGKGYDINMYRFEIDGVGGDIYGSSEILGLNNENIFYGSGGGGGGTFSSKGGSGGGIIMVKCNGNIIMNENSIICANGECLSYSAGAGSGGSIVIKCYELQMNETAYIKAIGGKHKIKNMNKGYGGDGGDGRIRIQCLLCNIDDLNNDNIQPLPYVG
eukprot:539399_1